MLPKVNCLIDNNISGGLVNVSYDIPPNYPPITTDLEFHLYEIMNGNRLKLLRVLTPLIPPTGNFSFSMVHPAGFIQFIYDGQNIIGVGSGNNNSGGNSNNSNSSNSNSSTDEEEDS